MTTPGTTLEQELLQAAELAGSGALPVMHPLAARLRLRATRARDFPRVLSGELQIPGVCRPVTAAEMFAWITGPIPSAAAPEGTSTAKLRCAACGCARDKHSPECSDCGCWGFFRFGAKRCDNPRCEGSACADETAEHDHGPNDVSTAAPETVPTERKP